MENLLQSQIHESCRLALPEGLKDLMSDISREVLRSQPTNLYKFITDYLSALLITREHLSIASRVCTDVYNCGCQPELEQELKDLGFYNEDLATATEIILEHFNLDEVKEASILIKLLKRIDLDPDRLPEIQVAIRNAFRRHQANHTTVYESSSDSGKDDIHCAVHHTMSLYRMTEPEDTRYDAMAQKIQAAYRAYGVSRYCELNYHKTQEPKKIVDKIVKVFIPETTDSEMTVPEEEEVHPSSSFPRDRLSTESSTSLAGSYMKLPRYKPYSAHEDETLSNLEEVPEKEHAHIDYTADNPHISISYGEPIYKDRKISFEIDDEAVEADDESVSVEEVVEEIENQFVEDFTDRVSLENDDNVDYDKDISDVEKDNKT